MVTLDQIRQASSADLFPCEVLDGCETALVLFAAGFHGAQDAVWVAEAGLTATCVDLDSGKLDEMREAYPDGWEFLTMDVFEFATATMGEWDVVTVDCPSNLFDRCADWAPMWCAFARKAVVLGVGASSDAVRVPAGWVQTGRVFRSNFKGGVYWAVLEREPV